MEDDKAKALRTKIAQLTEELAALQAASLTSNQNRVVAHLQALEAAIVALAVEIREEIDSPDLIERVAARLTHAAAPALRRLKDDDADRGADAVDSLANRLDQAEKRPKFQG